MQIEALLDRVAADRGADPSTSVAKALSLLNAFEGAESIGVSELSRRAGLHKSTAFRLLSILEQWSLVERNGSRYRLGTKLFELGNRVSYCSPRGLRDTALPYLAELYSVTRETVHLAVLDGTEVLYLEKLYGHNQANSPSYVGGRIQAHCSALGKAMLAHGDADVVERLLTIPLPPRTPYTIVLPQLLDRELGETRQRGTAIDREEATIGLTCVAAPIRSRRGRVVGAVSISGATGRFDPAAYSSTVSRAAEDIGRRIAA